MDIDDIVAWYNRARTPRISAERAQELYFQFHPRTAFLKMLPPGATVADIGAGDGSLSVFRTWPSPSREDLRMFAYSIEKGERFDAFEGYELSDWNLSPPQFGGRLFDAVVCCHFIEHIDDPLSFVRWAQERMAVGGRLYVEWPSAHSVHLPTLQQLRDAGLSLVIARYDDDNTHQNAIPDRGRFSEALAASGFDVEQEGIIRLPWLEEEMMANFRTAEDPFPRQAAYWSMTRWSQFVVASKRAA